jgi:methionine sulfoxide reductase heme-binding subunit
VELNIAILNVSLNLIFILVPPFKVILKHSFSILSVALICLSIYGFRNFSFGQMYDISGKLGVLATILFLFTIIPGIVQRLKLTQLSSITNPLRFSRRTLGVSMFFAALVHYQFAILFKIIKTGNPPEVKTFFIFGLLALFLSLWLALTSNTFAKQKMGKWWKRLHSLTYLIVWLIFAHVVLIKISPISFLVGVFAILEAYSLIKANVLDKKKLLPA